MLVECNILDEEIFCSKYRKHSCAAVSAFISNGYIDFDESVQVLGQIGVSFKVIKTIV